jgi:alpha-glucosidase
LDVCKIKFKFFCSLKITTFCRPAWTYHEKRKAWYYHTFLPSQPDLNLRNIKVREELVKVIDYWLKFRDVDGLRIDAVKHFYESETLKDEPMKPEMVDKPLEFESYNHIYTIKQPENYALLSDWRERVNQISKELKKTK